jgi:hypothetical protein
MDCGLILGKVQGLFSKNPLEGVSAVDLQTGGIERAGGKVAGGQPDAGAGAVAPWPPPCASLATVGFSVPCTKSRSETMGAWRRRRRTHPRVRLGLGRSGELGSRCRSNAVLARSRTQ